MSRRAQPYRRGLSRAPSPTLKAMKRGRSLFGANPADLHRLAAKKARGRRFKR